MNTLSVNIKIFLCVINFFIPPNEKEVTSEISKIKSEANKHALIIAIGDYDEEKTGWWPISSQNDVPLIYNSLKHQGFKDENITLLEDSDATKDGIVKAFSDLINRIDKGDIVVIHYSGHGQQIFDNNGDEIDGFDESLVSINAPAEFHEIANYEGQFHVRDDEIGEFITQIRNKIGSQGHVLVIMDSCHSGTGTRGGFSKPRGGVKPLAPDNYHPDFKKEEGFGFNEQISNRGTDSGLGVFVFFAGARFDQLNYETTDENGNSVGSLSYAISKAMAQVELGETYRSMFAKIMTIMAEIAPNQSPMIEGDIDNGFFGGTENLNTQTPYFNIKEIIDSREIVIDGGEIHNITKDSKVGIYKIGTKDPISEKEKLLMEGTVRNVSTFNSTVVFNEDIKIKNERSAWAFVTELMVDGNRLKVSLSKLEPKIQKEIEEKIKNLKIINVTEDNPDVIILHPRDVDSPVSRGALPIGLILRSTDTDIMIAEKDIGTAIQNYARGHFMKQVEYWDDQYLVDFEFIPVEMKRSYNGYEEINRFPLEDFMVDGVPEFPLGTQLKLKIRNKGKADAYFNILDIQPDGYINPIAPNRSAGMPPEVCKIEAGEEKEIPNYFLTIGPPVGLETFKIFATANEINLEPIIRSQGMRGTKGRGSEQFEGIELILSDTYGTRGLDGTAISISDGSSFNRIFKIVE